ncbi:mucin-5B-like [Rhinoderma darwinii]|uniref:mucin-5B-like n=1 Tax=Rhinoderma darwinii TaxID=43563 RepID=UPI003F66D1F2
MVKQNMFIFGIDFEAITFTVFLVSAAANHRLPRPLQPITGCRGLCSQSQAAASEKVGLEEEEGLVNKTTTGVCRNRTWVCDNKAENGKCTVYGEGHYITFDNKRYTINGDCGYTLVQDYCDFDHLWKGTFKVISENIPCGTTGTSCSKAIIVYLGAHKLILADEDLRVEERSSKVEITYKTRRMGLFLIIETKIGLVLVWDRKTTIYIYLSTNFKGKVCGLCGNFDDNSKNDFTTRSQCVVEDVKQFRDSWKFSPYCPEVYMSRDPCVANPYRIAWAQKLCNIILSRVFASCHSEVDPEKYYEACIKDTCACDMGGDCDCYCTAVSAYAQACSEACVCIEWRSPTICPLFCDFYNKEGQCDWHYMSCGGHCMKTCRNPNGLCTSNLKGLEGCYPKCPEDKPYFNEDEMQCVAQCGCLDKEDNYYKVGEKVESCSICEICICTSNGIVCHYDSKVCNCQYEGQFMEIGDVIQVNDSSGGCKKVHCGLNGTFETPCYKTAETTTGLLKTTTLLSTLSTTKEIQETSTLRESFSTLTPEVTTESSTTKIPEISTTSTASPQSTIFTTEITTFPTTKLSTALTSAITSPPPSSSLSSTAASSRTTTVPFTSQFPTTTTEFTEISDAIMTDIDLPRTKPNTAHSSRTSIHSTSKFTTTVMKSSSSQLPVYIFSPVTVTPNKAYNTNCVNITCHENGTFEVIELQCPVVQNITCEGESPPLKIYDQNGCCYHYECAHCVGPQGMIKNPGETWIDNCHYCTCDKYFEKDLIKVKITCNHVKCPPLNFSACDETWLKLYLIFTEEDPCCEKIECRCEPSQCQYQAEICSLGFEAVPTVMEGECCVKINCIPMNVCIVDGAVYQIGQDISTNRSSCKTCSCSEEKDPETGFNIVVCEPILCMILCPQGYVYETSNNDCCGKCIQVSCVVIAADGSSHLLKPGESQFLPDDNCTQYTCNFKGNIFVISSQTQVCPSTDEEECMSGLLENTPDGCCSICKAPKTCRIQTNVTEISQNGCSAHVSLSYCEGWCPSLRKFSEMSFQMEGKCVCCLETKTTEIEVELICPGDIDNIKITMSSAENCACTAGTCTT